MALHFTHLYRVRRVKISTSTKLEFGRGLLTSPQSRREFPTGKILRDRANTAENAQEREQIPWKRQDMPSFKDHTEYVVTM